MIIEIISRNGVDDFEICLLTIMVQVVPHITDAIKDWIGSVSSIPVDGNDGPADVCVIELGGTVGKITIYVLLVGTANIA